MLSTNTQILSLNQLKMYRNVQGQQFQIKQFDVGQFQHSHGNKCMRQCQRFCQNNARLPHVTGSRKLNVSRRVNLVKISKRENLLPSHQIATE